MVARANRNQIDAAELKARCLQIMAQVAKGKRAITVTRRGKPLVRIVPIDKPKRAAIFGCLADRFEIVGDIEGPVLSAALAPAIPRNRFR